MSPAGSDRTGGGRGERPDPTPALAVDTDPYLMNGDSAVPTPEHAATPTEPHPPTEAPSTVTGPSAPAASLPRLPAVSLPVLVCLPYAGRDLPDRAGIHAAMVAVIAVNGPAGATYRTPGAYGGLLRYKPALRGDDTHLLIREPGQRLLTCDGGSVGWLHTVAPYTPAGELIRVITREGLWLGPVPWRDRPGTPDVGPLPVTYLDRLPATSVVVMVEAVVSLRCAEGREP